MKRERGGGKNITNLLKRFSFRTRSPPSLRSLDTFADLTAETLETIGRLSESCSRSCFPKPPVRRASKTHLRASATMPQSSSSPPPNPPPPPPPFPAPLGEGSKIFASRGRSVSLYGELSAEEILRIAREEDDSSSSGTRWLYLNPGASFPAAAAKEGDGGSSKLRLSVAPCVPPLQVASMDSALSMARELLLQRPAGGEERGPPPSLVVQCSTAQRAGAVAVAALLLLGDGGDGAPPSAPAAALSLARSAPFKFASNPGVFSWLERWAAQLERPQGGGGAGEGVGEGTEDCLLLPSSLVFRQLFDAASSTFTYLLADADAKEAVLIDPVRENAERDAGLVEELGLELVFAINTCVFLFSAGFFSFFRAFEKKEKKEESIFSQHEIKRSILLTATSTPTTSRARASSRRSFRKSRRTETRTREKEAAKGAAERRSLAPPSRRPRAPPRTSASSPIGTRWSLVGLPCDRWRPPDTRKGAAPSTSRRTRPSPPPPARGRARRPPLSAAASAAALRGSSSPATPCSSAAAAAPTSRAAPPSGSSLRSETGSSRCRTTRSCTPRTTTGGCRVRRSAKRSSKIRGSGSGGRARQSSRNSWGRWICRSRG